MESPQATLLVLVFSSLLAAALYPEMFGKKKWNPRGLHCYVTGGSAGLGLALSVELTKRGADVSIVARDEEKLAKALEQLEAARQTPNQVLRSYSYSLTESASSSAALEAACASHGGRAPDAVFLCAGSATPGFFVELSAEEMESGMNQAYWVQAYSALDAAKRMAKQRVKGKIVFVSSVLGYFSMIGYSTYSPAKHALRGLAETLRSEFLLYQISTHIFFPGTIYSPGYVNENKTKPAITLKIEESDEGLQPEAAARMLIRGVEKGNFHISADLIGNLFRAGTRGASPMNNAVLDGVYGFLAWIGLAAWRTGVDSTILKHQKEHEEYLNSKGFFSGGESASTSKPSS